MCSASQTNPAAPQRVGLALGSNRGDRLALLEQACDALSELFGSLRLSQVYETEPVDCPAGSPPFLNACVEVYTTLPPLQVLHACQRIEQELGRERSGVYGQARTCDIDLIYYGTQQLSTPELTLPHPRAHLRRFVLQPLCDIDPALTLPGQAKSAAQLLAELPENPPVRPFDL
ncbi:MAG: 2-amino-4-hydroxy-6-hydroxymethyldihydropteridine diphosphokinase [Akkermansiaceae bacterium]|nr:2-amino-4-hydroxy-6-hydroxymethyldihydropteridine diphosphokinase [Akkermansiaceae bacterium]